MSSLRISHQNRAIAPPTIGDAGRPEHADDSGFALALGVAAGGTSKDGGRSDDSSGLRKRDNSQTKGNDASGIVAGVAGSLVATAAANSGAATIAGAAAGAPLSDRAADARSDPAIPSSPAAAATTTDAPASGSVPTPNAALSGQGQPDQKLETALTAPDGDVAAAGSPDIATFAATADVAGVSPLPGAAPAGPRLDAMRGLADSPSATQPSLPAVDMGQSAMADGGGAFASTTRDRFSPIAAATDTGDAAAATATATVSGGNSPALAAAAAATPALTPDPAGAGSMADQIAGHMARMLSNGTREVTMRLHPPELGDLTMRVAVNGRDVSAWFASPQPQVQAAISAALGQLQTDLGGAGYNLAGAWVGGDTSGARQQGWNNSPAASQVGASLAAAAAAPAAAVSQPSSSGLNIYV
ncbi:MAG TPA: flagellar hook-length control protein FliK [Stellaceae bacterium]|jgi:flagellar hook-length control protein FliK|nr:flagellar hook-length control protein FliK [Stellaceae bacterium]